MSFRYNFPSPSLAGLIKLVQKMNLPLSKDCMERVDGEGQGVVLGGYDEVN